MTQVISGLYENMPQAQRVVDALVSAGFSRDSISVVAHDAERAGKVADRTVDDDVTGGEGAAFGAVTGAIVGLGALLIPGIGPVVAGGPLIAALVGGGIGAVAGGVTGGITASLVHIGLDEETAHYYAEGIKRGDVLVTVNSPDEMVTRAVDVLDQYAPIDRDARLSEWRTAGWTGFADVATGGVVAQAGAVNSAGVPYAAPLVTTPVSDDPEVDRRVGRISAHPYLYDPTGLRDEDLVEEADRRP